MRSVASMQGRSGFAGRRQVGGRMRASSQKRVEGSAPVSLARIRSFLYLQKAIKLVYIPTLHQKEFFHLWNFFLSRFSPLELTLCFCCELLYLVVKFIMNFKIL